MRAQDFDTSVPLTLVGKVPGPLTSTGDDLLALCGVPVVHPTPARTVKAPVEPVDVQVSLF